MKNSFFSLIKSHNSKLIITLVWLFIVLTNYTPGTYIIGWDNLQTELNPILNISRGFNAVWQEYQGLGLLSGTAHAADLIRQLITLPLTYILPNSIIRYFLHFLMILVGSLGIFQLLKYLKPFKNPNLNKLTNTFSALFYMLNIGTIQNFYVPFEPFSIFYGLLPWMIISTYKLLNKPTKRNWAIYTIVHFLAIPIGQVQTVFLVYCIIISIIFISHIFQQKKIWFKSLIHCSKISILLFFLNAFWLLPMLYFTFTSASIVVQSKGNQLSTEETYLRNTMFGDTQHVMTLRGYWFDYQDYNSSGQLEYILSPWKQHFHTPFIQITSYFWIFLVIFGIAYSIIFKWKYKTPILIIFLTALIMLVGSNPPTGFVINFLQNTIPLFDQIFRSPFTKWIVPMSLCYSIFFGIGFSATIYITQQKLKGRNQKLATVTISTILIILIFFYSYPIFKGNYFYSAMRQNIPQEYLQLFDFFKSQDPSTRIANLPQNSFWGWTYNNWPGSIQKGYRGSGFLWYGIQQPIMDRAFDVWTKEGEQYYWEISNSIKQKNSKQIKSILNKYDITWIIIDDSVRSNQGKNYDDSKLKQLLLEIPELKLAKQINFINIYKYIPSTPNSFISLQSDLPSTSYPSEHFWRDQAYLENSDYIITSQPSTIYPFPSLFTNRNQDELDFTIQESQDNYTIFPKKQLPTQEFQIKIPNPVDTETRIPISINYHKTEENQIIIEIKYLLPDIIINNHIITHWPTQTINLPENTCINQTCILTLDDQSAINIESSDQNNIEYRHLLTKLPNTIQIKDQNNYQDIFLNAIINLQDIKNQFTTISSADNIFELSVTIPKQTEWGTTQNILNTQKSIQKNSENCRATEGLSKRELEPSTKSVIYIAQGTSSCDHYYIDNLPQDLSYIFKINSKNISSIPLRIGIQNPAQKRSEIETQAWDTTDWQTNWIIAPPGEKFYHGYTIYLDTLSFGQEINTNQVNDIQAWWIPYTWLKSIKLTNPTSQSNQTQNLTNQIQVNKKTIWLYKATIPDISDNSQNTILTLSQSYHSGWLAFTLNNYKPALLPHIKVNNWANGWQIPQNTPKNSTIYIFFWPQLLEFLGFGLLGIGVIWLWKKKK